MELELREFDRCRTLYERFLEYGSDNCTTWCRYAELETLLGDLERARGIYEIAIRQQRLDMPEVRALLNFLVFFFVFRLSSISNSLIFFNELLARVLVSLAYLRKYENSHTKSR